VNFTLGYIDPTHITARVGNEVDGLGNPVYRAITFLGPNLFQIAGTPAGIGVPVVFERTVPKESLIVNFSNGDVLDELNLDTSQLQTIMAVQEVLDGRFASLGTNLDFSNFTGINVRDPVEDTDIANKRYVDDSTGDIATIIPGVNAAAATATAAATAAAASAAAAAASAASASGIPNDNSVTTIKVVNEAITEPKIAPDAISTSKVLNKNITNAKLADMAQATVKGRPAAAGTGTSVDLTAAELRTIIGNVASGTAGLAPASGGGTTNFLRADGTWASPGAGGVAIVRTTEVVTTSGTVVDWTGLPADVHEIIIKARNISQSAADSFLVQLGTSGGFETTGYTSASQLSSTSVFSTSGFIVFDNATANIQNFTMCIRRVGSTNLWVADGTQIIRTLSGFAGVFAGEKTLAGVLTQVRLRLVGSANFDAGAVSLDYVRAA
jgi:hypothetical protein